LYKRIVVKVGTSTLTHESGALDYEVIDALMRVLADLKNSGAEVILVTSGAIAGGVSRMGLPGRPKLLSEKQAAAAVGQCNLMHIYDKFASEYNCPVAQILLTMQDFSDEDRKDNLQETFEALLKWNVLPIVNENDSVSTEEIESKSGKLFGDNDTLGAHVAILTNADLLVLLSDIEGLYTKNPRSHPDARLISHVDTIDPSLYEIASEAGGNLGTGGMVTKLKAAELMLAHSIDMIITQGKNPHVLRDIATGKETVGTLFRKENDNG
jgi:glutamate 5-kinase